MPNIQVNGVRLHYEEWGSGPESVLFAHGYLWSGWMFHPQIQLLRDAFAAWPSIFAGRAKASSPTAATMSKP